MVISSYDIVYKELQEKLSGGRKSYDYAWLEEIIIG